MIKTAFLTLALLLAQAAAKPASLQIEAALVYRNGDVKPVARVEFLLLDRDLGEILQTARLTPPGELWRITPEERLQLVIAYAKAQLGAPDHEAFYAQAARAIEPHILTRGKTGFDGKLTLNTRAASGYLVAATRAGRGWIVWNHRATLKPGVNRIIVEQSNATFYN